MVLEWSGNKVNDEGGCPQTKQSLEFILKCTNGNDMDSVWFFKHRRRIFFRGNPN